MSFVTCRIRARPMMVWRITRKVHGKPNVDKSIGSEVANKRGELLITSECAQSINKSTHVKTKTSPALTENNMQD